MCQISRALAWVVELIYQCGGKKEHFVWSIQVASILGEIEFTLFFILV